MLQASKFLKVWLNNFIRRMILKHDIVIVSIILVTILFLSACTGRIVRMQDERGHNINCEVSTTSAMMTGVLVRDNSIDECIKQHKAAGYKVSGEE